MSMTGDEYRIACDEALRAIEVAEEEVEEAKAAVVLKKTALAKLARAKADLECEFLGRSKTPLIEYAESKAGREPAPETADERQRGPTAKAAKAERADRRTAYRHKRDAIHEALTTHPDDDQGEDEPSWRRAPLTAIGNLTELARTLLSQQGVKTVGSMMDAVRRRTAGEVSGGVTVGDLALMRTLPDGASWQGVVRALDEYLDAVPGRRPAAPASPPPGTADPFEFAGGERADDEDLDEMLAAACWPAGESPDWTKYRKFGSISDRDILGVLKATWPAVITFHADFNATTRGGGSPAFWAGRLVDGSLPEADLEGPELLDAIRRVLRIPAPGGAPALPGTAATPPAKLIEWNVTRLLKNGVVEPVGVIAAADYKAALAEAEKRHGSGRYLADYASKADKPKAKAKPRKSKPAAV